MNIASLGANFFCKCFRWEHAIEPAKWGQQKGSTHFKYLLAIEIFRILRYTI